MACGILVPQPGIKPAAPAWQGGFLTTGPPGKPPNPRSLFFFNFIFLFVWLRFCVVVLVFFFFFFFYHTHDIGVQSLSHVQLCDPMD